MPGCTGCTNVLSALGGVALALTGLMTNPIFWLGLSVLFVALSLTIAVVVAIPAIRELGRAARSAEKLFDTLSRELPPTLEAIRLTGMEISDLTDDMSSGVQSAGQVVNKVDRSLEGARQQAQRVQSTAGRMVTGVRAAWRSLTRSGSRNSLPTRRSPDRLPPSRPPAVYEDSEYDSSEYDDPEYDGAEYGNARYGDVGYGNPSYDNPSYDNGEYRDGEYREMAYDDADYGKTKDRRWEERALEERALGERGQEERVSQSGDDRTAPSSSAADGSLAAGSAPRSGTLDAAISSDGTPSAETAAHPGRRSRDQAGPPTGIPHDAYGAATAYRAPLPPKGQDPNPAPDDHP